MLPQASALTSTLLRAERKYLYLEFSNLSRKSSGVRRISYPECRYRQFSGSARKAIAARKPPDNEEIFKKYRAQLHRGFRAGWTSFDNLDANPNVNKGPIKLYGYIGTIRKANKDLAFATLVDPYLRNMCQIVFQKDKMKDEFQLSQTIPEGSPVRVHGRMRPRLHKDPISAEKVETPSFGSVKHDSRHEMVVKGIQVFNEFPKDIIATSKTNLPPEQRNLQIRTDHELRDALRLRSYVSAQCRQLLFGLGFDEVETPLLFKSTPEGAREFIVPTRQKNMAYALPQSPQQYKQMLMSSGIPKYFQFAKCFRDEDMRADRQPEFTQLDLEIAFADSSAVKTITEKLIARIWTKVGRPTETMPFQNDSIDTQTQPVIHTLTYQEAMTQYGSDKPDLRYRFFLIQRAQEGLLPQEFVGMMTSLASPIVDFIKLDDRIDIQTVRDFLDSPAAAPYHANPAGPPAVLVFDPSKPLNGLAALGHDAAEGFMDGAEAGTGDHIFILQARETGPFYGGSTFLGNLRSDLIKFCLEKGLLEKATVDVFAWIEDFPLFKPADISEPGQGGSAGLQANHHPFTAPKGAPDFDSLSTNPLDARGDHYDLVINGVEVGGGSKRIHVSEVQEFIFRDVLKMSPERIEDFRHLLEALRAGCPPHAGIALGFDRLMAIICDRESVRDVIAFPKWGAHGEDKMVKSPAKMTEEQLETYHLSIAD